MVPGFSRTAQKVTGCLSATSVFLLLAGLFGLFFVFRTPLLWGFDETSHVARAYQVSQGHFLAQYLGDDRPGLGYGGKIPANLLTLITQVDHDVSTIVGSPHLRDARVYGNLGRLSLGPPSVLYAFTNTAEYPPVAYIPASVAIRTAGALGLDMGATVHLARLADLSFYMATMAGALRVLRRANLRWVVFAVGLLPISLFEASMITADTVTNSVAFLLSALVVKALFVDGRLSKADEVLMFLAVSTLPVLKPAYVLVDLLVLLVPQRAYTSHTASVFVRAVGLVVGLAAFGAWQGATSGVVSDLGLMRPGPGWQLVSPHRQLDYVLGHPLSMVADLGRSLAVHGTGYLQEMFGQLSFANINIPAVSTALSGASLVVATGLVKPDRRARWWQVGAFGAVVGASSLLIFLVEYLSWSNVGATVVRGVNGRYFVPLFVLLLSALSAALARLAPAHAALGVVRSASSWTPALTAATVSLSLLVSCAHFDHAMWA
jgi:uncharacterized membrane protein